ncbi:MAG TPA: transposase [Myxococcaceae bacterium]|nr:transposase [Myxococcaceae bacterium]
MGWPIRMFVSGEIYLVTLRCIQGRSLLRPSERTNEVLGGVLARAVRLTGVELFAFAFASTHLHLLIRAPRGNLPRFMQHLATNISKKVGFLTDWQGAFWERRYSAQPVLDEAALLDRLRYLLAHGPKEGLVRKCAEWPGLSSLKLLLDRRPRRFRWFDWTRRSSSRDGARMRSRFDDCWAEPEELVLAPLPCAALRTRGALGRFLRRATEAIEREAARSHRRVLGVAGVLRRHPQHRPARLERKPRPLCHTTVASLREEFRERYRAFTAAFQEASSRWKAGDLRAQFPDHAFRPFLWPQPRPERLAA